MSASPSEGSPAVEQAAVTGELLSNLDEATKIVPKMLDSLSSALEVLEREPRTDEEKVKWERDLKGFSGQYYGRLHQIQVHLRQTLHTLCSPNPPVRSPFALVPAPPSLRPAFSAATPATLFLPPKDEYEDLFSDLDDEDVKQEKEAKERDEIRKERELGLYALRLEMRSMQELVRGLKRMQGVEEDEKGDGDGGERGVRGAGDLSDDKMDVS